MKKIIFIISSFFIFSACSFLPQKPTENFSNINQEIQSPQFSHSDEKNKISEFLQDEQNKSERTQTYKISHVIDGDTLYVIVNGKEKKIRILGIDTPEKMEGFEQLNALVMMQVNMQKNI